MLYLFSAKTNILHLLHWFHQRCSLIICQIYYYARLKFYNNEDKKSNCVNMWVNKLFALLYKIRVNELRWYKITCII